MTSDGKILVIADASGCGKTKWQEQRKIVRMPQDLIIFIS
jgi:hypothetical protein